MVSGRNCGWLLEWKIVEQIAEIGNVGDVAELSKAVLIPAEVWPVGAGHVDERSVAGEDLGGDVRLFVGAPLLGLLVVIEGCS